MSIPSQEAKLFEEWSHGRVNFAYDGVVDIAEFTGSQPRIVFLLKEVNYAKGGRVDLRRYLRDSPRAMTWNNVARWSWVIRDTFGRGSAEVTAPWPRYQSVSAMDRATAIRKLAIVNVKKKPGNHRASTKRVTEEATRDCAFLERQITLYGWSVLVACGLSRHAVVDRIPCLSNGTWQRIDSLFFFKVLPGGQIVIRAPHPAARLRVSYLLQAMGAATARARTALEA